MADEHRPLLPSDQVDHHLVDSAAASIRRSTRGFLTSKAGHYSVLLLVSLDISCIFADLILQNFVCEGHVQPENGAKAQEVLGVFSLAFSCLFMVELIASVWAFGWRFWRSWFHWLDATVIITSFVVDVVERGIVEEIGSLVVILRLWRVIKIIEELSAGAAERMEPLNERIADLEKENKELRVQIEGGAGESAV